jgi:hypothetical protein
MPMRESPRRESTRQSILILAAFVLGSTVTFGFILGHGAPHWIAAGVIVGLTSAIVRRVLRGSWWY